MKPFLEFRIVVEHDAPPGEKVLETEPIRVRQAGSLCQRQVIALKQRHRQFLQDLLLGKPGCLHQVFSERQSHGQTLPRHRAETRRISPQSNKDRSRQSTKS